VCILFSVSFVHPIDFQIYLCNVNVLNLFRNKAVDGE